MNTVVRSRDQTLIEECLHGRSCAFEELIRPYQDRVYNVLFRLTGDRDDAAELFQEVMIRTYRGLASYQGGSSFYTWLYRIALNVFTTSWRRRRGRLAAMTHEFPREGGEVADPSPTSEPSQPLEQAERSVVVQRALAAVPDPYRAVLVLKDVEGMKYEEIAEVLDIPVGTVRSRLHRARAELRESLKPLWDRGVL